MAKRVPPLARQVLAAEEGITVANALGANIPTTAPAMGKVICSAVCSKLSSFWGWCFCASTVATWIIGAAALIVIGEVLLRATGLA